MQPLLNLEQAGELLGLTRPQMYELTSQRSQSRRKIKMPVIRIGKRCMFRETALEAWIAALESGA